MRRAVRKADKKRLTDAALTVVLCCDEREHGCATAAQMRASWKHLRRRAKQRAADGVRITTVRAKCLGVCQAGPLAGCFDEAGGAWYAECDADGIDAVLAARLDGADEPTERRLG